MPIHFFKVATIPGFPSFRVWPGTQVASVVWCGDTMSGLLLLRDDKDFQSCDSATQTLCGPYKANLQSLYSKYTGCADWRIPDFGGTS